MKKLIIALALSGLFANVSAEQPSEASVKELMALTGSGELGIQAMHRMIAQLKPLLPMASERFWDEVKKEAKPEDIVNIVTPIYQKHLTQAEIDATIAFYKTPEGKQFVAAQPQILQESMIAGQAWGEALAKKIVEKYKAKYQVEKK